MNLISIYGNKGSDHRGSHCSLAGPGIRPLDDSTVKPAIIAPPRPSYSIPEAADYITSVLARYNLGLPPGQADELASAIGCSGCIEGAGLEKTVNEIASRFPKLGMPVKGVVLFPEPINLIRHSSDCHEDVTREVNLLRMYRGDTLMYRLLSAKEERYFAMLKDSWKTRSQPVDPLWRDPDLLDNPITLPYTTIKYPKGMARKKNKSCDYYKPMVIRYKTQKTACDALANHNLRLVIPIANRYSLWNKVEVCDLIQEGNLGLMRAIFDFDYTTGYKLSSYAVHWIRQAVAKAACWLNRTIRLPAHITDVIGNIRRVQKRLTRSQGFFPDNPQIASELGVPVEFVGRVIRLASPSLSLDDTINTGPLTRKDILPYFDDRFERTSRTDSISGALRKMELQSPAGKREKVILCLSFGLLDQLTAEDIAGIVNIKKLEEFGIIVGKQEKTPKSYSLPVRTRGGKTSLSLKEIGLLLKTPVGRERARQIEKRAIKRLKHPSISKYLQDYYTDTDNYKQQRISWQPCEVF